MKSIIKRVSCTDFTDLSGNPILHMTYYIVQYSSGNKKEYRKNFAELPASVIGYIKQARIIGKAKGFYCESAYTITTTYRKG